jgi:hypothetical protein
VGPLALRIGVALASGAWLLSGCGVEREPSRPSNIVL